MKKKKKEKPILYEAWLSKKYQNYNQEEEVDYIKMFFTAAKNILWAIWHIALFILAGIGIWTLANGETRRVLLQLLSSVKF